MADLEAARRELDRIEGILRTRYHYPHPIFEHLAAVLEHLEAPEPKAKAEPKAPVNVDSTSLAAPQPKPARARKQKE